MKKILGMVVMCLFLSVGAYAMESLQDLLDKDKPWYKKLSIKKNPVSKYMKKRNDCKDYADRADTVYLGKQRYETCMEN